MAEQLGSSIGKLGFGFMRLPKRADGSFDMDQVKTMVDHFMEAGFTYFDTAYVYDDGASERALKLGGNVRIQLDRSNQGD